MSNNTKVHDAMVTILESFNLGKKTGKSSGITIDIFGGKDGGKLGTIQMGQGTFAWYDANKKKVTKKGKQSASRLLNWTDFADLMNNQE